LYRPFSRLAGVKELKEATTMATPSKLTLLDLVQAVSDCTASEAETVATVAYLINSGKVLLCGTFAGAKINLSAPVWAGMKRKPSPLALHTLERRREIPR
jgi:hypothetical protein